MSREKEESKGASANLMAKAWVSISNGVKKRWQVMDTKY